MLDPAAPHTRKPALQFQVDRQPKGFNFETARETDHVYHLVLMPAAPGPRSGWTSEESGGPSKPLPSCSAQEENPRAKRARSIAAKQAGLFFIGIRYESILELLNASGLMMLTSFLILRQPSSPDQTNYLRIVDTFYPYDAPNDRRGSWRDSGGDFPGQMPVPDFRIKTLLAYSATPATPATPEF